MTMGFGLVVEKGCVVPLLRHLVLNFTAANPFRVYISPAHLVVHKCRHNLSLMFRFGLL